MTHTADTAGPEAGAPAGRVHVWDGLVRSVHWAVAILFLLNFAILEEGEALHRYAGYAILTLVSLRLGWGIVGTRYARFDAFPPSVSAAMRHLGGVLSGRVERHLSHNPLGALMAYLLWALLIAICLTGMATWTGALGGEAAEALHELLANLAAAAILVHIGGVAFETWRSRMNLVRAMVTGDKDPPAR
jgi:cytochrome b